MKDIPFEKSFASHPKSKYWSKLNELKSHQVFKGTGKMYWFDCNECHHSFDMRILHITKDSVWCPYCSNRRLCDKDCVICFQKSFASNPKSKFWSDKNELKSYQVFKSTGKKYLFDCNICNHEFEISLDNITCHDKWCPYCTTKICKDNNCQHCFKKLFASHPKSKFWSNKNKLKPSDVAKSDNKKYWFNCDKCDHDFNISLNYITNANRWCSYCANRKLCDNKNCNSCFEKSFASHPKSKFWSNINELKPRQVFRCTNIKYTFDCKECNNIFDCSLNNIINNRWCPKCKFKTQLKLLTWLQTNYKNLTINSEKVFDWTKNIKNKSYKRYDFFIKEYKLLIELDGLQHFKQVWNWQSPEENKMNDEFKNKLALENDCSIIRISQEIVFCDLEDWDTQLKQVIKKYDIPELIKIGYIYNNN
jgi:very-short-patch-repair endonuclease